MGLFDKIKKAFDTGGIKVTIEAPKRFDWSDPAIPARVTVTGHESESRSIAHLSFTLKDDGDNQGAPGMRDKDRPHQPDGRRFTARYDHPVALDLRPGESRTVEVAVPLAAGNDILFWPRPQPAGHAGRYCAYCGEVLLAACPECGAPLGEGGHCGACGAAYVNPPTVAGETAATWTAERRRQIAEWRALL